MARNEFAPVTPGKMLKEEFLTEYGLSQSRLAKAIGISPNRIAEIVHNRRRITADTALRLSLYFGNSPEFWMNLQTHYDLKMAQRNLKPEEAKRIKNRFGPRESARYGEDSDWGASGHNNPVPIFEIFRISIELASTFLARCIAAATR